MLQPDNFKTKILSQIPHMSLRKWPLKR
jgi:hypothetical protein